MRYRLLLVDDDPLLLSATELLLKERGYLLDLASTGKEALEKVRQAPDGYALVVLDYRLGNEDAASVLEALRKISPDLFVIIYSGDSSRDAMKQTWKAGAVGFIEKDASLDELLVNIANWCQKYGETTARLDPYLPYEGTEDILTTLSMVGRSLVLRDAARKVQRYRTSAQNVLITGDTGTGKELIARALHGNADTAFIAINCAAYKGSTDLLESELFGYEKGAFTGADREKKGALESADGGTVFLDEVHHLSLTAQAKLLRLTQEKKIRRVGGVKEYPVSFRLITAAKPDLEERCERGEFLRDFYHRLNVLSIHLPPLKERPEDIEPLVGLFCRKFQEETGQKKTFRLRTLRYLESYPWPGNVRELENMVYRLLTDCEGDVVGPEQLDADFFRPGVVVAGSTYQELKRKHEHEERQLVQAVLGHSDSKFHAAKRLQISPSTLHSIMKRVGLYSADGTEIEEIT